MKNRTHEKRILFTGGHHNSAVSVIDWLCEKNSDIRIFWAGSARYKNGAKTPEWTDVTARGIPFYNIHAGKLFRFTALRYFFRFLRSLLFIPVGFIEAFIILKKVNPQLIVSFGGYIALPVVVCGRLLGIQSVTHEQTITLGLANKLISRLVSNIYTTWPVEYYRVDDGIRQKMHETGLPLNTQILHAKDKFQFSSLLPVIYISGGKSGSEFINRLIMDSLEDLLSRVNIIWSAGRTQSEMDYKRIMNQVERKFPGKLNTQIVLSEYFGQADVAKAFNTADFVVSRAGAHTIYELYILNKPGVLIPIPWASNNEQMLNANMLKDVGLAEIIDQETVTTKQFIQQVDSMLHTVVGHAAGTAAPKIPANGQERLGNEILKAIK